MIETSVNTNSVHIPMVQTGCLKAEFDSTYPIHLNGIISQDEFRESIHRINRTIPSNRILIILGIGFGLFVVGGMICFIVGGVTAVKSHRNGFPPLVGVGIALITLGMMIFTIGCCIVQSQYTKRLRQAIAEESIKYSSRSTTPCSWRLDTSITWFGRYGYHNNRRVVYHLVIDIGRSITPAMENAVYSSSQKASESTPIFSRQDNYVPPPYSNQSSGFCSQCGTSRQDLTAKFCSSCGKLFHQY
ncbi:unnamed protein product [Rotaria sordida]|uniref:Uncharacterized protein n=1 Tax=Rotaria sordida TaxID=392033 RepID=A0A814SF53_9BILA|nr:unnamed protein product [Rotaria sordida]CAF3982124.1 unnamed protein product [Rotaria sordida]